MNKGNDEVRSKISQSQKERWASLSEAEKEEVFKQVSKGMKGFWGSMTPEEKREYVAKRTAARRANRGKK